MSKSSAETDPDYFPRALFSAARACVSRYAEPASAASTDTSTITKNSPDTSAFLACPRLRRPPLVCVRLARNGP